MKGLAEPSLIADLQEIERLRQYDPLIPFSEREKLINAIQARVKPIVQQEFAKLADGEVTPLIQDLLKDPTTMFFCRPILYVQMKAFPADTAVAVFQKVFDATPDSQRGGIIQSFLLDLPKEAFGGKEIQQWFVDKINGKMPIGLYYFVLTDESARAVSKTAIASMRRFPKMNGREKDRLFSLMSAVFLASRGDESALKLLDSLLDQRDINSDTGIILAAAMSGNEKLIKKILGVVTTDKRTRFMGEDCLPPEFSFAHEAAVACAMTIEGFPHVEFYDIYDDEAKEKVRQWIESNPKYMIKPTDYRMFLKEHFEDVFFSMR